MRRVLRITFFGYLHLCASLAWSQPEAVDCERLVATGNPEYPPYLWRESDSSRMLEGANRIIMEEISRRLEIPIDLVYTGPWSRAQEEVRAGRVDLMAGAFYTESRTGYMDYISPPFLTTRSVVWKRDFVDFEYSEWEDLIPYEGATVINNSFGQAFDSYAQDHLHIDKVASLEQAFRMLAQGRVDYVLYEEFPGHAYAEQMNLTYVIEQVGPPISEEQLYLTVSRESDCNTEPMQRRLAGIMESLIESGFTEQALVAGLDAWNERK